MSTLEDLSNGLVQLNFQREALIDSGDAEGANLVTQEMTVLATELEKIQGQTIPEPKEVCCRSTECYRLGHKAKASANVSPS